jgi:hypothetical protein
MKINRNAKEIKSLRDEGQGKQGKKNARNKSLHFDYFIMLP